MAIDRKELVKHQLRDSHGRWIKMGFHVKWTDLSGEHTGKVVNVDTKQAGAPKAVVHLYDKHGKDLGVTKEVAGHELTVVAAKATLKYDDKGNVINVEHDAQVVPVKNGYHAANLDSGYARLTHEDANPAHGNFPASGMSTKLGDVKVGEQLYPVHPDHGTAKSPYNMPIAQAAPQISLKNGDTLGTVVKNDPAKGYIIVKDANGKDYAVAKSHWGVVRNAASDTALMDAQKAHESSGTDYKVGHAGPWIKDLSKDHVDLNGDGIPDVIKPAEPAPAHEPAAPAPAASKLHVVEDTLMGTLKLSNNDYSPVLTQVSGLKVGDQIYPRHGHDTYGSNSYSSIGSQGADTAVVEPKNPQGIATVIKVDGKKGVVKVKTETGSTYTLKQDSFVLQRTPELDKQLKETFSGYKPEVHQSMRWMDQLPGKYNAKNEQTHTPSTPAASIPTPAPAPAATPAEFKALPFDSINYQFADFKANPADYPVGTLLTPAQIGSKNTHYRKRADGKWDKYHGSLYDHLGKPTHDSVVDNPYTDGKGPDTGKWDVRVLKSGVTSQQIADSIEAKKQAEKATNLKNSATSGTTVDSHGYSIKPPFGHFTKNFTVKPADGNSFTKGSDLKAGDFLYPLENTAITAGGSPYSRKDGTSIKTAYVDLSGKRGLGKVMVVNENFVTVKSDKGEVYHFPTSMQALKRSDNLDAAVHEAFKSAPDSIRNWTAYLWIGQITRPSDWTAKHEPTHLDSTLDKPKSVYASKLEPGDVIRMDNVDYTVTAVHNHHPDEHGNHSSSTVSAVKSDTGYNKGSLDPAPVGSEKGFELTATQLVSARKPVEQPAAPEAPAEPAAHAPEPAAPEAPKQPESNLPEHYTSVPGHQLGENTGYTKLDVKTDFTPAKDISKMLPGDIVTISGKTSDGKDTSLTIVKNADESVSLFKNGHFQNVAEASSIKSEKTMKAQYFTKSTNITFPPEKQSWANDQALANGHHGAWHDPAQTQDHAEPTPATPAVDHTPTPEPAAPQHSETPSAAPEPAPSVEHKQAEEQAAQADAPMSIEGWTKIAGKSGSNPGGVYKDGNGKEWMVKFPQTSDHARNEVLAANLTRLAGLNTTDMQLIDAGNGKLGVASPMVKIEDNLKHMVDTNPEYKAKVQDGFAVDAWLSNWDTVGLSFDNIATDANGDPLRLDPGGALLYRAMGSPKGSAFGNSVGEWDSLRNGTNWQTAHVFGDMTDQQLIDSAKHVEAITPEEITKQVKAIGFDEAKTKELTDKLIARREDVIKRAAELKPAEAHAPQEQAPAHEAPAAPEAPQAPAESPASPVADAAKPYTAPASGYTSADYTPEAVTALDNFTSTGFNMDLQSALRSGDGVNQFSGDISALDQTIANSPLSHDVTVWRGISANDAILAKLTDPNGGTYFDKAYTSTTMNPTLAEDWVGYVESGTPVVMKVELPAGFHAHALDYGALFGDNSWSNEKEVILPRNTAFDVSGVEKYTNGSGKEGYKLTVKPILSEHNYTGATHGEGHAANTAGEGQVPEVHPASDSGPVPHPAGEGSAPEGAGHTAQPEAPAPAEVAADPYAGYDFIDKGKTATDSQGNTLKAGDLVTQNKGKIGQGKVWKVLPATDSVKVVYPDGTVKVHKAHTVTKASEHVEPKPASELPKLSPGEHFHDTATGKSYIGAKDGTPLAVGDRITYTKQGQTKSGTVKAIYKGDSAVAITWDDGSTSGTKKKASAVLKEDVAQPSENAPEAPQAPAEAPSAPEAPAHEETPAAPQTEEPKAPAETPAPQDTAPTEAPAVPQESPAAEAPANPAEEVHYYNGSTLQQLPAELIPHLPVGTRLIRDTGTYREKTAADEWRMFDKHGKVMLSVPINDSNLSGVKDSFGHLYTVEVPSGKADHTLKPTTVDKMSEEDLNNAPVGSKIININNSTSAMFKNEDGTWHVLAKQGDGSYQTPPHLSNPITVSNSDIAGFNDYTKGLLEFTPADVVPSNTPEPGTKLKDLTDQQILDAPVGSMLNHATGVNNLTKGENGKWDSPTGASFTGDQLVASKKFSSGEKYTFAPAGPAAPSTPETPAEQSPSAPTVPTEGTLLKDVTDAQIKNAPIGSYFKSFEDGYTLTKAEDGTWSNGAGFSLTDQQIIDAKGHGNASQTAFHPAPASTEDVSGAKLNTLTDQQIKDAPVGSYIAKDGTANKYVKGTDGKWTGNGGHSHDGSVIISTKNSPSGSKYSFHLPGTSNDTPAAWEVGKSSKDGLPHTDEAPVGTKLTSENGQSIIKIGNDAWQNVWPDGDVNPTTLTNDNVQTILDSHSNPWTVADLNTPPMLDSQEPAGSLPPHLIDPSGYYAGEHVSLVGHSTLEHMGPGDVIEIKGGPDNTLQGVFVRTDVGTDGWAMFDHYAPDGEHVGNLTADEIGKDYASGDYSGTVYTSKNGYHEPGQPSTPAAEPTAAPESPFSHLVGMKLSDITGVKMNEFPVGTKLSDANGYLVKTSTGWKIVAPDYHNNGDTINDSLANVIFSNNASNWTVSSIGPGDSLSSQPEIGGTQLNAYEGKKLFEMPPINFADAPAGTTIVSDGGMTYMKAGDNSWHVQGTGWSESANWADGAVKEAVYNTPDGAIEHTLTKAGGAQDAPTNSESTSLKEYTKEQLSGLPVDAKISYDGYNGTHGTYVKKSDGTWQFTANGYSLPSSSVVTDNTFEHLLGTLAADNYHVSLPSSDSAQAPAAEIIDPYNKHGVSVDIAYLDSLPVGSTFKKEVGSSWVHNPLYAVKNEDGSWDVYKKTTSTLKKEQANLSSDDVRYQLGLVYGGQTAAVSIPKNDSHFVTGSGEIGYVGDVVKLEDNAYSVVKINKTGLSVEPVGGGPKTTLKPSKLTIKEDFAVKQYEHSDGTVSVSDPATSSYNVLQEKVKAENKLKNFAGGNAEEFNKQGLVMPHDAAPDLSNGIKSYGAEPVDESNPLYGAPKPEQPQYQAPDMPMPTKWDSAAWLEKVKQRYLDNPNKAKASLEQSNKWSTVQQVANEGDLTALQKLLESHYVDQNLFDEASSAIDKGSADYSTKMDAYNKAVADAQSVYNDAKAKYNEDLAAWNKANPASVDKPFVAAVLPSASTENFAGGQADWTKAHIGTHTAATVMSAIKDDNALGTHGLSFAVDSDQIEHLDVKTTKVINAEGDQVFEFKFKVTGPHGAVIANNLNGKGDVKSESGIYAQHMEKDPATGLLRDKGKPVQGKWINSGTRYSYTDPETGAKVWYQKSDQSGINVSTNDNSVRIHMPLGSTPEDFQRTIENLGIKEAKPSTEGDIRVLAENQILALFGKSANGVDIFDPNQNHTGEERAKQLEAIKQKWNITPEDAVFKTESNGRVRFEMSDAVAKSLSDKYNIGHFQHNVSGGHDVDRWVTMIAGDNPGMLSTYHRFSEGIGGEGASSATDMSKNAGDYNYLTPKLRSNASEALSGDKIIVKPSGVLKRLDYWANPDDSWGKRGAGYGSTVSPIHLFEKKLSNSSSSYYETGIYEILPKDSVPVKDWSHVSISSSSVRQGVIDKLKSKGIYEINGIPVEDFVQGYDGKAPNDLTQYN